MSAPPMDMSAPPNGLSRKTISIIIIVIILIGLSIGAYFLFRKKPHYNTPNEPSGDCETNKDCNGQICNNGKCFCGNGFVGKLCQFSNKTCNNNGTVDQNGICSCTDGYTGSYCTYSDATTCNGNGTVDGNGICTCNSGHAGPNCNYFDCSDAIPRCKSCTGTFANPVCIETIDDTVFDLSKCTQGTTLPYGCPIIEEPFPWMNYVGGSVHVTYYEDDAPYTKDTCCINGATGYHDPTLFNGAPLPPSMNTNYCYVPDFTTLAGTTMDGKAFDFTKVSKDGLQNPAVSGPSLCNPVAYDTTNTGTCYLTLFNQNTKPSGSTPPYIGNPYYPLDTWYSDPKCNSQSIPIVSERIFNKPPDPNTLVQNCTD